MHIEAPNQPAQSPRQGGSVPIMPITDQEMGHKPPGPRPNQTRFQNGSKVPHGPKFSGIGISLTTINFKETNTKITHNVFFKINSKN